MNYFRRTLLLLAACQFLALEGIEFSPWYQNSRDLEFLSKTAYQFQSFNTIDTVHGNKKYASQDQFLNFSLSTSHDSFSVELETTLGDTPHLSFGWMNLQITGRQQQLREDIGDPYTLAFGATLAQNFHKARHDISSFYQGGINVEFHASIGKECLCREFWISRSWASASIGLADVGSPWFRLNAGWDLNCWDWHMIRASLLSLWGLGEKGLHLDRHFKGYGAIHHQSIDFKIEYLYHLDCGALWALSYARRLYALNFPRCVNQATLTFYYPFGL